MSESKNIVTDSDSRTETLMFLHEKNSVIALSPESWERQAFHAFETAMADRQRPFPCTLGIAGLAANQLRFHFITHDPVSDEAAREVAAALQSYVPCARGFGKNTSLVVMFKQSQDLGLPAYEALFWRLLNAVHQLDARPWPDDIPRDTESERWEFSFAGEPMFVVCNTPSHKQRASRHAENFMVTFQPRWVFDGVIGPQAPNSDRIKGEIRRRLAAFDAIPPSPDLGAFGEAGNREWTQYFLGDTNEPRTSGCPFHPRPLSQAPSVIRTAMHRLDQVVDDLLPPTGAVEVQRDTPHRIHGLHRHGVDETLHVVEGQIDFQVAGTTIPCGPGDRLLLPSQTLHASKAGPQGCLYVIATRTVPVQGQACVHQLETVDVQ